jgi:hypothetical protein
MLFNVRIENIVYRNNLILHRELCDGLHSNVHLNQLDLRLPGNQLEAFVHEHSSQLATIPSLTALDLTGCGKLHVNSTFIE